MTIITVKRGKRATMTAANEPGDPVDVNALGICWPLVLTPSYDFDYQITETLDERIASMTAEVQARYDALIPVD